MLLEVTTYCSNSYYDKVMGHRAAATNFLTDLVEIKVCGKTVQLLWCCCNCWVTDQRDTRIWCCGLQQIKSAVVQLCKWLRGWEGVTFLDGVGHCGLHGQGMSSGFNSFGANYGCWIDGQLIISFIGNYRSTINLHRWDWFFFFCFVIKKTRKVCPQQFRY